MKFVRLHSMNLARKNSQHCETVLPVSSVPCIKSSVSPDSLVSQNSNFPTTSSSYENDLPPTGFPLASLLTQTNNTQEDEDDFYMHDLYSLDEGDEDRVPSPAPKLGALLSCPVKDTSLNSSSGESPSRQTSSPIPSVAIARQDTVPIVQSPTTPQPIAKSRGRQESCRLRLLASNMDVSPFNPQTRPLIRRTLSLCTTTPPADQRKVSAYLLI